MQKKQPTADACFSHWKIPPRNNSQNQWKVKAYQWKVKAYQGCESSSWNSSLETWRGVLKGPVAGISQTKFGWPWRFVTSDMGPSLGVFSSMWIVPFVWYFSNSVRSSWAMKCQVWLHWRPQVVFVRKTHLCLHLISIVISWLKNWEAPPDCRAPWSPNKSLLILQVHEKDIA